MEDPGQLTGPAGALPGWAASAHYLALTTFCRNGDPVTTPVWFAADGDRLLVWTEAGSGKVKRLRANPAVTIAPCSVSGTLRGTPVKAAAAVLPESAAPLVQDRLNAKYGLEKRLYAAAMTARRAIRRRPQARRANLEIRIAGPAGAN